MMTTHSASYDNATANINVTDSSANKNVDTFDQLLPTLVECFLIIFCGYIAGRFKFIRKEDSKGMNYFTANLAMPAMIFLNLASLDFRNVDWTFFAAILASKSLIFIVVVFLTSIVQRPVNLSVAAIYAIFVTHLNDFGLGYPIFTALYAKKNPLYPGYIYLIGQISLVILNPMAFILMEIERARTKKGDKTDARGLFKIALKVTWKIVSNPNVWMTALAILVNICFYEMLPKILHNVLTTFAAAFQSLVLFLLGICVVGVGKTKKQQSLVMALLLVIKILVTPLATRATVQLFCSKAHDKKTLQDYGFLYGTIPTAPVVLLYAVEFGLPTDMLAAALVLCTLISGPVMYISTRMIAVQIFTILQYMKQLKETLFYLSIISFLSSMWVTFLIIFNGWWKRPPYSVVGALLISQLIMSLGVLTWSLSVSGESWSVYLQIISITGGLLAVRFWTALLSITIMIVHRHAQLRLSFLNCYYLLFGFGIPAGIVCGLMFVAGFQTKEPTIDGVVPSFLYGHSQAYSALVVLTFCLVTTMTCLVMYSRDKRIDLLETSKHPIVTTIMRRLSIIREESSMEQLNKVDGCQETTIGSPISHDPNNDYQVQSLKSAEQQQPIESDESKVFPHIMLLLLQCVSMIVGIIVTAWRILADDYSGIYIAMEFLDVVLTFGQGFYCLVVYGHYTSAIIRSLLKIWTKLTLRLRKFRIPKGIDDEAFNTCSQFLIYHYHDCVNSLPRVKIWNKLHNKSKMLFSEDDIVQWLLKECVVPNKEEGLLYVQHLCTGDILRLHKRDDERYYYFNPEIKQT